ncbi:glycoside hydrolase family 2 TIM barrel-domain containing protein [Paraflavitalea speifideaquila]|uniref:glycoside hydrolase family 2 TIM barrel-domain containing protein n=1 Tax=Paraflavitalea speifideaquila TaxID=3076558 RepID=UPI0028E94118|nr:glycoside hydrolase family 2 TIM barrel-domain containing protein [Paraflavitalea speifideiaquila]
MGEADTRSFIRRDRNHPSVIAWSFGNEVGEQYTEEAGAKVARRLYDIVKEEDSTRPATASMNYAKPTMPFPGVMDILSLNYQGRASGMRRLMHIYAVYVPLLCTRLFKSNFPEK